MVWLKGDDSGGGLVLDTNWFPSVGVLPACRFVDPFEDIANVHLSIIVRIVWRLGLWEIMWLCGAEVGCGVDQKNEQNRQVLQTLKKL